MAAYAYYNEIDPFAAQWLRNLIAAGHIADGEVDTRSIEDVRPIDLMGFTQCHFFAGIGVWSYALRLAGWPDDRPVWTGSCPCPPFSIAGKKKSCPECGSTKPLPHAFRTGVFRCTACGHDWFADGRHLWPEFYRLIRECCPVTLFGEQVAGSDGLAWGDIVQSTLELEGYAVGRLTVGACGVEAPHIRQRLYFVANANIERCNGERLLHERRQKNIEAARSGCTDLLDNAISDRRERRETPTPGYNDDRETSERTQGEHGVSLTGSHRIQQHSACPTNGFWRNADWLLCKDGKFRPVEPGAFPLVNGTAARVGRLRGYGNAISAPLAAEFIKAYMEVTP